MQIEFTGYDAVFVASVRSGGVDANGQVAERTVSDGGGNPCRSCLHDIPKGAGMLICAGRPFAALHPYAETGPIFLCADDCAPWLGKGVPPVLTTSPDYLVKAYSADERIIYGTGQITLSGNILDVAGQLLSRDEVAFVDIRSSRNNCFQTRVRRG